MYPLRSPVAGVCGDSLVAREIVAATAVGTSMTRKGPRTRYGTMPTALHRPAPAIALRFALSRDIVRNRSSPRACPMAWNIASGLGARGAAVGAPLGRAPCDEGHRHGAARAPCAHGRGGGSNVATAHRPGDDHRVAEHEQAERPERNDTAHRALVADMRAEERHANDIEDHHGHEDHDYAEPRPARTPVRRVPLAPLGELPRLSLHAAANRGGGELISRHPDARAPAARAAPCRTVGIEPTPPAEQHDRNGAAALAQGRTCAAAGCTGGAILRSIRAHPNGGWMLAARAVVLYGSRRSRCPAEGHTHRLGGLS
jgi:hypothetical protein